jgi:hypothetical protein
MVESPCSLEKALLLSKMVVAYYHYHPTECEITWAECDLRRYLNGHFYNSLEEEKSRIAETVVVNDDHRWYGTKGGADTNDKLFLLSIEEADRYFGDNGDYLGKKRTNIFRDIHYRKYLSENGEELSNDYIAHAAVQGRCRFAAGGGAAEERKKIPFFGIFYALSRI